MRTKHVVFPVILLVILLSCRALAETVNIIYPRIEERMQDDYGLKVLDLALKKSGLDYRLRLSDELMNQDRAKKYLELGKISVLDFGTNTSFEQRFLPVYFPIDGGLSGFRLLITNRNRAVQVQGDAITAMKANVAGQGAGWADVDILRFNGFKVTEAPVFNALFRMLEAQRFDFFPLGVDEIYRFYDQNKEIYQNLIIDEHIALHYPFARLFFVSRKNVVLRDAIYRGLKMAFDDGSLLTLLKNNTAFYASMAKSRLNCRQVIELENPYVSDAFSQIPKAYFWVASSLSVHPPAQLACTVPAFKASQLG
ncbi:hypothetical protein [Leeia oryzae]|uniref:hypothetical protein n=1 Tax=Leeia oryzae TaxID=356662 RepID=UPI00037A662F|nr:hypothetical protein [Leeia oryzae]